MTTRIPALRQRSMAAGTSGRGGSSRPTRASSTRSSSRCAGSYGLGQLTMRERQHAKARSRHRQLRVVEASNVLARERLARRWCQTPTGTRAARSPARPWRRGQGPRRCDARSRAVFDPNRTESHRPSARRPARCGAAASTRAISIGSPSHRASERPVSFRSWHRRAHSRKSQRRREIRSSAPSRPGTRRARRSSAPPCGSRSACRSCRCR